MNAVSTDSLRSSTCVTAATPCEFVTNTDPNEPRSATRTGLCRWRSMSRACTTWPSTTLGITVGLFDEYGPAQRMYARRGYIPDGRGACQGQRPLSEGTQVRLDHDVIIWLTEELTS